MRRALILIVLALMLSVFPSGVFAAGSAATGSNNGTLPPAQLQGSKVNEVCWAWTSDDTTGSVSNLGSITGLNGSVVGYKAIPSSGGTKPTDLYDVTISDGSNAPILQVSNLHDDVTDTLNYGVPLSIDGNGYVYLRNSTLNFSVANAGNSKQGTFCLYVYVY